MNRLLLGGLSLVGILGLSSPALASGIDITLTGAGTNGGLSFSGTAQFVTNTTTDPGVLFVTLANTTGGGVQWNGNIAQTLTGVTFSFTGGGTITGFVPTASTPVAPTGSVDCSAVSSGTLCPSVALSGGPLYNWIWGANGNTPNTGLYASQLHPDEIVNSKIVSFDGLKNNDGHNPLLLTTTFKLSFTGTIDGITGGNLFFGTDGGFVPSGNCTTCQEDFPPAPEPGSLVLLGTGLLAGAALLRRRFVL